MQGCQTCFQCALYNSPLVTKGKTEAMRKCLLMVYKSAHKFLIFVLGYVIHACSWDACVFCFAVPAHRCVNCVRECKFLCVRNAWVCAGLPPLDTLLLDPQLRVLLDQSMICSVFTSPFSKLNLGGGSYRADCMVEGAIVVYLSFCNLHSSQAT